MNATATPVYSNRNQFKFRVAASKKLFTRLHSNDRRVYENLLEIINDTETERTRNDVRTLIRGMLNGPMHDSMRNRLHNLIMNSLTRDAFNDMLDDYEGMLKHMAPEVLPVETMAEYAERTNLPEDVIRAVFIEEGLITEDDEVDSEY